jgi:hypothetical protein
VGAFEPLHGAASHRDALPVQPCPHLRVPIQRLRRAAANLIRLVYSGQDLGDRVTGPLLEACAATCKSCGDECARHARHHEHCRVCEQACRRCEQACWELLGVLK